MTGESLLPTRAKNSVSGHREKGWHNCQLWSNIEETRSIDENNQLCKYLQSFLTFLLFFLENFLIEMSHSYSSLHGGKLTGNDLDPQNEFGRSLKFLFHEDKKWVFDKIDHV